jgi:hypothetical protein
MSIFNLYVIVSAVSAVAGSIFGAAVKAWFSKKVEAPVAAEIAAAKVVVADVKKAA